jgi:hypothetical protein
MMMMIIVVVVVMMMMSMTKGFWTPEEMNKSSTPRGF